MRCSSTRTGPTARGISNHHGQEEAERHAKAAALAQRQRQVAANEREQGVSRDGIPAP